jgi:hypothetical protein
LAVERAKTILGWTPSTRSSWLAKDIGLVEIQRQMITAPALLFVILRHVRVRRICALAPLAENHSRRCLGVLRKGSLGRAPFYHAFPLDSCSRATDSGRRYVYTLAPWVVGVS